MSYRRLKASAQVGTFIGLALLSVGIGVFMMSDEGTKPEKLGIVFMTYGGIMIGMGFTAWVAFKTKL